VWEEYARSHFIPIFGSTEKLTESGCAEYRRVRLGKVLASTVRHELTALRNFVSFCALEDIGAIPEPFAIAGVPKRFAGSHLRSAMTTHELEQGKNIIGIQYRVGHKLLSTTSRYVKPSFRAAMETIAVAAPEPANLGAPQKKGQKRKTA